MRKLHSRRTFEVLRRTSSLSKNGLGVLLYRVPNDVRIVVFFNCFQDRVKPIPDLILFLTSTSFYNSNNHPKLSRVGGLTNKAIRPRLEVIIIQT